MLEEWIMQLFEIWTDQILKSEWGVLQAGTNKFTAVFPRDSVVITSPGHYVDLALLLVPSDAGLL